MRGRYTRLREDIELFLRPNRCGLKAMLHCLSAIQAGVELLPLLVRQWPTGVGPHVAESKVVLLDDPIQQCRFGLMNPGSCGGNEFPSQHPRPMQI